MVFSSIGQYQTVAPYSGAIFASVDLSGTDIFLYHEPKYSTNFSTTHFALKILVTYKTTSVVVTFSSTSPSNFTPITSGTFILQASPSNAASASIPHTPQPSTPSPFTIVVCESVPNTVSGNKSFSFSSGIITGANFSTFT
jgi:hypothetical protein